MEIARDGVQPGRPEVATEAGSYPRFSPDGRWIVYASWESGTGQKWTPDESQFGGRGGGARHDDPAAPPDLFTAIQEQLGLQLKSVKAPVDVLVIDRVEKPSEN